MSLECAPAWMTLADAGKMTGESRTTMWRRAKNGTLRTVVRGRTIMVPADALADYMGKSGSPTFSGEALRLIGSPEGDPDEVL